MPNKSCCGGPWAGGPNISLETFLSMTLEERLAAGFTKVHDAECSETYCCEPCNG